MRRGDAARAPALGHGGWLWHAPGAEGRRHGGPMDIADAIDIDLEEIEHRLDETHEAASGSDEAAWARALEELIWALQAHTESERRTLYEPCIEAGGELRACVERSHRRLEAAIRELGELRGRHDPRLPEAFASARSLIRRHAREEEEALLAEVHKRMPEYERAALAVSFIVTRDRVLAGLRTMPHGNPMDPAPLPSGPGFNDGEILR